MQLLSGEPCSPEFGTHSRSIENPVNGWCLHFCLCASVQTRVAARCRHLHGWVFKFSLGQSYLGTWKKFSFSEVHTDTKSLRAPSPVLLARPVTTPRPFYLYCGSKNFLCALMTCCEDCPSSWPFVWQSLPFEFDWLRQPESFVKNNKAFHS